MYFSHEKIGYILWGRTSLDEALKTYRDSLAIAKQLAAAHASHVGLQSDLSASHEKVGDVLMLKRNLDEAAKAYSESLAIREQLVAAHSGNRNAAHLSVAHDKVGDELRAQGKPDEALKTYHESLAIRERLAAADASNAEWQRDFRFRTTGSATYWVRRASSTRRPWPFATASPFANGSPPQTVATSVGSAICRSPTAKSRTC